MYGQDVSFTKEIGIQINGSSFSVSDIDTLLGKPRHVHQLDSNEVVMVDVTREGETTVSAQTSALLQCVSYTILSLFNFRSYICQVALK